MKNLFLFMLCSTFAFHTYAQADLSAWEGEWRGTLKIFNEKGIAQTVPMGLNILKDQKEWKWQIIYGEHPNQDFRDYSLIPTENPSQFKLDEHNGIILRLSLLENTFHSVFEMNDMTLLISYSLNEDQIVFRSLFSPETDKISSGGQDDQTPEVKARKVTNYQIAELKKQ